MRIFNITKKTILILSFVFFGVAFFVGGVTLKSSDMAISTVLLSYVVGAFVGFFLSFSGNNVAKRIGYGLTTGTMLIELFISVSAIETDSVAAILGLVSVIFYVVYFLVALVGFLAIGGSEGDDPETDPKIKKITGWKKLLENGIISEEEFEAKRQAILGFKGKNEKK